MLNNIVRPEPYLETSYELRFYVDAGGGFAFPCNADGIVTYSKMTEAAIENYHYCMEHPEKFPYYYNLKFERKRWIKDNPYGICRCGERVDLVNEYMGACQCPKCGQWYNLFGQELLPPDEWEESIDEDY